MLNEFFDFGPVHELWFVTFWEDVGKKLAVGDVKSSKCILMKNSKHVVECFGCAGEEGTDVVLVVGGENEIPQVSE